MKPMATRAGAGLMLALLLALGLGKGPGAAPPPRYRALSASEAGWVNRTRVRFQAAARAGNFEETARLVRELYELRRRVQGPSYPDTVDSRLALEDWERRSKVPAADRPQL